MEQAAFKEGIANTIGGDASTVIITGIADVARRHLMVKRCKLTPSHPRSTLA
jgi:hypothetical protein